MFCYQGQCYHCYGPGSHISSTDAEKGYHVKVISLSFGERGESAKLWRQEGMTLPKVKASRRVESEKAADILGAAEIEFWDIGDYPMRISDEVTYLFDLPIVKQAIVDSFRKLTFRRHVRNPVMFVVYIGSILTRLLWLQAVAGKAT